MSLANDQKSLHTRYIGANALIASRLIQSGFTNVIQADMLNFASGNRAERIVIVGEEAPGSNYTSYAVIGDEYWQFTFTSGVVTAVAKYVYTASGVWSKVLTAPTASTVIRTAATKEIETQSSNSGTGDQRGVYAKITLTHASAGSGDALRGYAVTTGGAIACRGAHLTGEIGAAGSVTGLMTGATCQITVATGLTLNTGTISCVQAITNNESSLLGVTDSAHIRIEDGGTYGMSNLITLGTIVGRSTDKAALGPYSYISAGCTVAVGGVKAMFRVKTADGVFYIPGYLQAQVS
jgi:hypothetical protein